MKKIRENLKYAVIFLGLLFSRKNRKNILPSMLNSSDTNGPGRFIRNLENGLEEGGQQLKVIRNPFCGASVLLVISSMPIFMYKLMKVIGVKVVLRVDGFSYPDLYDNAIYSASDSRATREFTLNRIKTNYQIQTGLKLADWVVFQSDFSKQMSAKWLYNRIDKFSVIANGVDIDLFRPRSKSSENSHIISVHGNLRDLDIVRCILRVFSSLNRECHNYDLYFRIIGNVTAEIAQYVEQFLLKDKLLCENVDLIGGVTAEKLANLLPTSSVSLHLTSGDACPNSVLESLSCGVPVVCQAYGGQSNLVGNAGVIIDSGKVYDYSDTIVSLAVKGVKELIYELGDYRIKARQRAEQYYSFKLMTLKYKDVFENVNLMNDRTYSDDV